MAAQAHESPHGLQLVWSEPQKEAVPVVLTNRGLVFAAQAGVTGTYDLRCNEAYGVNTSALPHAFIDDTGRLALATYERVASTGDRGCTWTDGSGLPDLSLGGFTQTQQHPNQLLITTVSYQTPSQVFVSEDYGRTWSVRATNQALTAYDTLLSSADGATVFASGKRYDQANNKLIPVWASSSDGGKTWQDQDVDTERYPLGMDPTNAQVVFAREPDPLATLEPEDTLLRSEDGGKSFTSLLTISPISAFASTPDGATMWVGSSTDGLYRSTDGGKRFARVQAEQVLGVFCLHYRAGRLWLCARWAPNTGGIWSSDDLGESWSALFTFADVTESVSCPAEQAAVCELPWRDWQYELLALSSVDAGALTDANVPLDASGTSEAHDAGEPATRDAASSAAPETTSSRDAGLVSMVDKRATCGAGPAPTNCSAWPALVLLALGAQISRRRLTDGKKD